MVEIEDYEDPNDYGNEICLNCNIPMKKLSEKIGKGEHEGYLKEYDKIYECPRCGAYIADGLKFSGSYQEEGDIDDLVELTRIDPDSFENFIEKALMSRCFVEAISLIHNVIEAYLKKKIEDATAQDSTRFQLLKEKFKPQYLQQYNVISYLLGIIDKDKYFEILKFNSSRNKVIHDLMTKSKSLEELREIARLGRKIQIELSPLNHSEEDLKNILKEFDRLTEEV